ncbi:hypothetical protein [Stenoxybacter acetivorans]|uniref:hypothetical protein n=1 Tax=Stenoxybacter acetivorans TaxID=422441 RepID=UPI0012EB90A8|nr:hypothetical protein [Stenoxybacter acetivorans]
MMIIEYGLAHIQDIRSHKDQGADCLINLAEKTNICVACYAPQKVETKKLIRKINKDFQSYLKYWQKDYPCWCFYTNSEPSPESIKQVRELGTQHQLHGLNHLIQLIEQKTFPERLQIYRKLKINDEYIGRDFLERLFDEILLQPYAGKPIQFKALAPAILEKININTANEQESAEFRDLMISTLQQQTVVEEMLSAYENTDLEIIKYKVVSNYSFISTSSDSGFRRLLTLIHQFNNQYNRINDDELRCYISAFVWCIFSQCLIGVKQASSGENNGITAP